jgi:hypothetical protein
MVKLTPLEIALTYACVRVVAMFAGAVIPTVLYVKKIRLLVVAADVFTTRVVAPTTAAI